MADRFFIDGFEGGNTGLWDTHTGDSDSYVINKTNVLITGYGGDFLPPAIGDYCFYAGSETAPRLGLNLIQFSATGLTGISTINLKFRLQFGYLNTICTIIDFINTGGTVLGTLSIRYGILRFTSGGTYYQNSTVLGINTWYNIELFIEVGNDGAADGAFGLRIDGQTNTMNKAVDTITNNQHADNLVTNIQFRASATVDYLIDDFVLADAHTSWDNESQDIDLIASGMSGDGYITGLIPTIIGDDDDWTGALSTVTDIGIKATVDSTIMTTTLADQEQSFDTFETIPTMETVYCVQVCARTRKEGEPPAEAVQLYVKPDGGIKDNSDSLPLSRGTFHTEHHVWNLNPDDDEAWEQADLELAGFEVGVKTIDTT